MNSSPPSTPPSRPPEDHERRFKNIGTPCEWVENYHPGGFHPVHLGDAFDHGRYRIVRKLGEGSFSTVWLARDTQNNTYVALKILMSEVAGTEPDKELRILQHLFGVAPVQAARFVTRILGEFEHIGPNGTHKCLVFEAMGPTVNSMVEELPQFKPRNRHMKVRYPPQMARTILKQSLEALDFLHGIGIAHGDFQPGNMLFALDDIDSQPEDALRQKQVVNDGTLCGSISPPVERLDGKQDQWAPRYLCVGKPLVDFTNYTDNLKIKLSDMGGAYFFQEPPLKPVVPAGLRPPELVLSGALNETVDIWSFGCLIFELVTGRPLFLAPWYPAQEYQDDDLLIGFTSTLGPLPDELYKCGVPLMLKELSMEEIFDEAKPEIAEDEAKAVKLLIRRILQYDPAKRPSAAEILQDPWFSRV
ncbi:serine protein kinase [Xylaria arbuscula]|nr:serine protein kinase [Xylaria arbuscula]